jgi:hypothetical protein
MNTSHRKLRHFGAPLLIVLLSAALGWLVQAIGIFAVLFIVIVAKRFGKFEAKLAATIFTIVSALFALALHSQSKVGGELLETACALLVSGSPFLSQVIAIVPKRPFAGARESCAR